MKTVHITIHPLSALLGAALVGGILLVTSASQTATASPTPLASPGARPLIEQSLALGGIGPIQVEGIPTPGQMVRVEFNAPLVVPVGKLFVATGAGDIGGNSSIVILFDGVYVYRHWIHNGPGIDAFNSTVIPPGLVAAEGTTVSIQDSGGIIFGYLADA